MRKETRDWLSRISAPVGHIDFPNKVFLLLVQESKKTVSKKKALLREYEGLSRYLDDTLLQDSSVVRNALRARHLAKMLIDRTGSLDRQLLASLIEEMQNNLYSLAPGRHYDAPRQQHVLRVLKKLRDDEAMCALLNKIHAPINQPQAEQLIKDTLLLSSQERVDDATTRRAVLSAWLTYLRQNVGSCFATAPAIMIQDEQPKNFLNDIDMLLSTGCLSRTFAGKQYVVPLSISWGAGDLKKNVVVSQEQMSIGNAPGLVSAFEKVGLFKESEALSSKMVRVGQMIKKLFSNCPPVFWITPEDVIRGVLLQHHGITEGQLEEEELREARALRIGLVAQTMASVSKLSLACDAFKTDFEKAKTGFKAMTDNALLKSWEFALASFSETKADFARWNLYSSLGLKEDEEGGIGECLRRRIEEELRCANEKTKEYQEKYEEVHNNVVAFEQRLNRASEKEAAWFKAEHQQLAGEMNHYLDLRNTSHGRASKLANLFAFLIKKYIDLFQNYFQEVYDADIHETAGTFYDDSPAGFRLLYKHGRTHSASWTMIQSPNDYINALAAFFLAAERELSHDPEIEGLEKEVGELTTAVVNLVRTEEFLETAFVRMAKAHGTSLPEKPLENLDKVQKKPWVYISGGTIDTLVNCYFSRETPLTEETRWVENELELLVCFIDAVRDLPPKEQQLFLDYPEKSLLAHSPTHAFLLKPGKSPFKEAWQRKEYPYTWIRDQFILPARDFVTLMALNTEMIQWLLQQIAHAVPYYYHQNFFDLFSNLKGPLSPQELRDIICEGVRQQKWGGESMRILPVEEVDATLYAMLPCIPKEKIVEYASEILGRLPCMKKQEIGDALDVLNFLIQKKPMEHNYIGSRFFQDLVKSVIALAKKSALVAHDYHLHICQICRQLGLALHQPILFADTNWIKHYFAFLVNPGTAQFELWRTDYAGSEGKPMSIWKQYVDGSSKKKWGVYPHYFEYHSD
ncbi:hypothetical protein JYU14_03275 [Simkania negevensis]|uniref:Uncharacterized protein n=1 Tax=Simkania negevensis TaxID=83561 RepID=A0ABS3ARV4_9BACT|nr:hypothetical protein [Simkania negevensis]